MRNITIIAVLIAVIGSLTGCTHTSVPPTQSQQVDPTVLVPNITTNNGVYAVVVGMENSSYFGECPGSGLDAARMAAVLKDYACSIRLLINTNATKRAVVSALSNAISKAELVIFYYSGHGGQAKFINTSLEDESDGMDEYLCLDDSHLRDNDVWNIIKHAKSRVWCIFDCCHSQSIFRNTNPLQMPSFEAPLKASHYEDSYDGSTKSFLIWSGCPDNTYSYGSSSGGEFTNALLYYFSTFRNARLSYDDLWFRLESDTKLILYEEVQRTVIGKPFGASEVFK